MRYKEFQLIKEGYKEVTVKFITASSDESEVKKYMMAYKDLVNRNQVQGDERNIDWWGKQGWENFEKFVSNKSKPRIFFLLKPLLINLTRCLYVASQYCVPRLVTL